MIVSGHDAAARPRPPGPRQWVILARHAVAPMTAGLPSGADAPLRRSELAKSASSGKTSVQGEDLPSRKYIFAERHISPSTHFLMRHQNEHWGRPPKRTIMRSTSVSRYFRNWLTLLVLTAWTLMAPIPAIAGPFVLARSAEASTVVVEARLAVISGLALYPPFCATGRHLRRFLYGVRQSYCAIPSTAKILNFPYLSPILRASR